MVARRALVFAHHRQHVDRRGDRRRRAAPCAGISATRRSWSGLAKPCSRQMPTASHAQRGGSASAASVTLRLRRAGCEHLAPPAADALDHLEDARGGDRTAGLAPGIEIGTTGNVLAADVDDVAETLAVVMRAVSGALALQDQVGGDGGAVQDAGQCRTGVRLGPGSMARRMPAMKAWLGSAGIAGGLGTERAARGAYRCKHHVGEGAAYVYRDGEG